MKVEIIGIAVNKSKNGNVGTRIYATCPMDEYTKETALVCEGQACIDEYIRGDYSEQITIGEQVVLVYGKNFKGEAVLEELLPV